MRQFAAFLFVLGGCVDAGSEGSASQDPAPTGVNESAVPAPSCPIDDGVVVGNCDVRSAADVERLDTLGVTAIGGTLSIAGVQLSHVSLPLLEHVGGGVFLVDAPEVESISLGGLKTVGEDVWVANNPALVEIFLPALEETNALRFRYNEALEILDVSALTTTETIVVSQSLSLRELRIGSLTAVDELEIVGGELHDFAADQLGAAGSIFIGGVEAAEISFAALTDIVSTLQVSVNPHLVAVNLPALEAIGDALVEFGNPSLDSCALLEVMLQLESADGVPDQVDSEALTGVSEGHCPH